MQFLVFILAYPMIWVISRLPYRWFYGFSDVMFFLAYRVVGYRKAIVRNNLKLVFPEKGKDELHQIEKNFYAHMCDMFLEMVKTINLSSEEVKKRYEIKNIEVLQKILNSKTTIVVCSHYANWEWNVSINNYIDAQAYAVYQKIGNTYFDAFIRKIRAKWNTVPILQTEIVKTVVRNERDNVVGCYGMVSDQSPMISKANYWTEFMGVKAPIFTGAEMMARKMDLAVVFLKVSKVKRGHYQVEFIPIATSGSATKKYEITNRFLRLTENQILENPEYYFWTHRRWKHRHKVPGEFA